MNKNATCILLIVLLTLTAGCTARSTSVDKNPPEVARLEKGPVYLAPMKGSLAENASWEKTLEIIDREISRYAASVSVSETPVALEKIIADAGAAGSRYAFVPDLEILEMPAENKTGHFKIEMSINVYDLTKDDPTAPVMDKKIRMKGVTASKHGKQPEYLMSHMVKQFALSAY